MVAKSGAPDAGVATSGAVHQIGCSGAISGVPAPDMTVSDPVHRIMVVISGAPDVGVATSGAVHQIRCSGAISGALGKKRGKKINRLTIHTVGFEPRA